jgi:hypothetical protein
MNAVATYRNGAVAKSDTPRLILEVIGLLNAGTGFKATPDMERSFTAILSGYEPDVLRFAAREYSRQRSKPPSNPSEVALMCGLLLRAIEAARPKYSARTRRAEPDTFVAQFVAACGNDTRAFIEAQANAPRAAVDVDDDDRAELLRRIELTRERVAEGRFVDAQYGLDYLAHLEAQL